MNVARKPFMVALLSLICVSFIGCVTLKKGRPPKLFRARDAKPFGLTTLPMPAEPDSYRQKYKAAYIFWERWHGELIDRLGGNRKKEIQARQQSVLFLEKMQGYLVDEKKEALTPYIVGFRESTEKLMKRRLNRGEVARLKRSLEKQKRDIHRYFSYEKMEEWIKEDITYIPPEYLETEE